MGSGEGEALRLAAPTEITGNKGWFPKAKCMLQSEGQWKGVFNAKKKKKKSKESQPQQLKLSYTKMKFNCMKYWES